MIALDLETHLIKRPIAAPKPVCAQWCDRAPQHDQDGSIALIDEALEKVRRWLASDELHVGHSVAYDMTVLMAYDETLIEPIFAVYEADRVQDTLLNQKLIDIANGELEFRKTRGYDLGTVAKRHGIDVDKADPWRLKYAELEQIPLEHWPDDAKRYAILDATATYRIAEAQFRECAAWEAVHGSPILHQGPARARADLALRLASIWGVRTDAGRCEKLEAFTQAEIARMREELVGAGLVRNNGSKDTKAARARVTEVFTGKGLEIPLTEKGEVSTEKDTMILGGDETLILYAEYTTANNLLSRCEDLKKGVHLPLQPRYDSLLETGRTSSSKGTKKGKVEEGQLEGIQIQNFPRGFDKKQLALLASLGLPPVGARECVTPREGNVFVLADGSSAELHGLAQIHYDMFGLSALRDILNAGKDVHLLFGCEAYGNGVSYEDVKQLKSEEPYKGWRQAAKPIVFGRPGGMGAKKIVITARKSYGVIFDLEEAKRLIRLYDYMIPELPEYFRYVNGLLGNKKHGLMRQFRSGRWRGGATYSAIANSGFQGLIADGYLAALFKVAKECYSVPSSALYGFRIVAFVHDEIVTEGPEHLAHDAAMRLQAIMEQEMNVFTPDCPTPAEPVVTRVWSKDAKQVWVDGRLMPWEPKWLQEAA